MHIHAAPSMNVPRTAAPPIAAPTIVPTRTFGEVVPPLLTPAGVEDLDDVVSAVSEDAACTGEDALSSPVGSVALGSPPPVIFRTKTLSAVSNTAVHGVMS